MEGSAQLRARAWLLGARLDLKQLEGSRLAPLGCSGAAVRLAIVPKSLAFGALPGFVENDIDFDILPTLTSEDLKELGFSLGDRKRIQAAIGELLSSETPRESKSAPVTAVGPTVEAERRHPTVLLPDPVGSTELSLQMDPEALLKIRSDSP